MAVEIKLIVVDASPLMTLGAAQSLDYLLYAQLAACGIGTIPKPATP